mmetsp:Transcript_23036/g.22407  ORF Transcript_23036/g.22407 Transcript_23036/m.22407 type:complete len:112 (+) Transcript_23036:672-1007(+)|eukprot:CAMPEP_0170540754 /NCGR_PEP_ID=MMETSP0211-20121228/702_1 /TAXON_ID=311385 /ORGANISM="Pseudokeronopsis sp., Strain OXSARD2" /LENGTH=111 /DNA_ID=CAMNT_0010843277 /DNA_START=1758 /DNA_END=2093 /DNA_ORIENTATION=+
MEATRQEQKIDMQLKAKDIQLNKFQEQIKFRDDVINQAKRTYMREDLDLENLDDPRIMTLDEMMKSDSFFPPINNNYGKATGALVKSLVNNFSPDKLNRNEVERYGKKRGN